MRVISSTVKPQSPKFAKLLRALWASLAAVDCCLCEMWKPSLSSHRSRVPPPSALQMWRRSDRKFPPSLCLVRLLTSPSARFMIKDALVSAMKDSQYTFNSAFKMNIEHKCGQESIIKEFAVHHNISGLSMKYHAEALPNDAKTWASEMNLIPWVAVASQLPVCSLSQLQETRNVNLQLVSWNFQWKTVHCSAAAIRNSTTRPRPFAI